MNRKILILFLIFFLTLQVFSQELNCQINVVHSQIQGTNTKVFDALRKDITEFMNNKRWTEHVYSNFERIECNIMINLKDFDGSSRFTGTLQIQARRPVFGSSYNTVLLNHKEEENELRFEYLEKQPLEFVENTHTSNLTSVLAFYAYIILGLDYDSFSQEGGTQFFQKAQNVVNVAQNSNDVGWKPYESKNQNNRYYLVETFLSEPNGAARRCSYRYHRNGLDVMADKVEQGRSEVAESFKLLQKVFRNKPNALILKLFFSAKADEIVSIFSEGQVEEKTRVYNLLKEIDVGNASKYEKIVK